MLTKDYCKAPLTMLILSLTHTMWFAIRIEFSESKRNITTTVKTRMSQHLNQARHSNPCVP